MKRTILAVVIATLSASAFADAGNTATRSQHKANQMAANAAVASVNHSRINSGMDGARAEAAYHAANGEASKSAARAAADAQAAHDAAKAHNAQAQYNAAQQTANKGTTKAAVDAAAHAASLDNYGVKGNPNLTSQYTADPQKVSYNGVSQRPSYTAATPAKPDQTESMNMAAGDVNPSTPVQGPKGEITTAGEVAKVDPTAQISVPHAPALIVSQRQGSDHSRNNSRSEHGTGNGGNNAANSNSAHGLGGGNHIGGGSAQSGSRNVGHW